MTPWINDNIKIQNQMEKKHIQTLSEKWQKTEDYELLTQAVSEVPELIEKSNDEYCYQFSKLLNDPSTIAKSYWTILKTFHNKRFLLLLPTVIC